jgi:perosamine synthetase
MAEETRGSKIVPNARPYLDEADHQAIQKVVASGWIAEGDEIGAFESDFASFVGCKGGVAVSSGFAALHLCLVALNIGPGDEVIVPCVSTCHAIRNAVLAVGAKTVFADTNRRDFNLSLESVSKKISRTTRAIIAPHHTGVPSNVHAINKLGVPVIEDCAQALGGSLDGRPLGSIGFASIFSFYATKLMTTVDGGMVTSQSTEFLERVRDLRYYRGKRDGSLRYNYKLQNLHAALGRSQLIKLPHFLERRRAVALHYLELLDSLGYPRRISLHDQVEGAVYYRLGIRLPPDLREELISELEKRRISFGMEIGFLTDEDPVQYPNALRISQEIVTFPTYAALTDSEVEVLIREIGNALTVLRRNGWTYEDRHPST